MTDAGFDLASAILIFMAAVIPIYFSFKLRNNLRPLMIMLSVFAITHGFYHTFEVLGYEFLAENIVEPLSYAVLIIFGLAYMKFKFSRKVEIH